jgi:hypothetical protein
MQPSTATVGLPSFRRRQYSLLPPPLVSVLLSLYHRFISHSFFFFQICFILAFYPSHRLEIRRYCEDLHLGGLFHQISIFNFYFLNFDVLPIFSLWLEKFQIGKLLFALELKCQPHD